MRKRKPSPRASCFILFFHGVERTARTRDGKGYDAESFIVDRSVSCGVEMISEQRKAKEHDLVKKPDISMMDFHPHKEQTAGDKSKPTKEDDDSFLDKPLRPFLSGKADLISGSADFIIK